MRYRIKINRLKNGDEVFIPQCKEWIFGVWKTIFLDKKGYTWFATDRIIDNTPIHNTVDEANNVINIHKSEQTEKNKLKAVETTYIKL